MTTKSGNFNTAESEVGIVKRLFDEQGINYSSVIKNPDADAGDVLVEVGGKKILIEVKEEIFKRYKIYGDLGIDFLSEFHFTDAAAESKWKGSPKHPSMLHSFMASIDRTKKVKPGKISYSKSHLWLFYVMDGENIFYSAFFDGEKMTSQAFRDYLEKNCFFAVNNKPRWQMSHSDPYQSASFFIHNDNEELNKYRVDNVQQFIDKLKF